MPLDVNNQPPGTAQLWPLATYLVNGPTIVAYGPMLGGFVANPAEAIAQGLTQAESIFVDLVDAATLATIGSTVEIVPGQRFDFPDGFTGHVSVNASSRGHKLAGLVVQSPPGFKPSSQSFPPNGPTTITGGLPSYLFEQYDDDDDLQTAVDAYNSSTQAYIDWFVTIGLPVYTGPLIVGALLDWIAGGIYGLTRPVLPSGRSARIGPYNTWAYNTVRVPYNTDRVVGPSNFYTTTDDVFKRVMTWSLWKGDGKYFNIRWLKRRIMRFLTGENGGAGTTDQSYQVSVTFGVDGQVNINLQGTRRVATGGAIYNVSRYNGFSYNTITTKTFTIPVSPLAQIFKAAMDAGALPVPFQFTFVVNIN